MQRAVEHLPPPCPISEEKDEPYDMLEGAEMSQEKGTKHFGDRRKNPAYRNGWGDGRFGPRQLFLENSNLAGWAGHQERLAYYRGHREGQRVREMKEENGDSA
jgi:hypothetical protein